MCIAIGILVPLRTTINSCLVHLKDVMSCLYNIEPQTMIPETSKESSQGRIAAGSNKHLISDYLCTN